MSNGREREDPLAMQQDLVRSLSSAPVFDHPADAIEVHETHISWVVLAGGFAYKIKKSVDFGFLDFSTLEKRHYYCHEELRLNRRFAARLYLDVVRITGSTAEPRLDGPGEALEYAVKMRRFPQDCLLVNLAARGELTPSRIDELAALLADMHAAVERADAASGYGRVKDIEHWVQENFDHIRSALQQDDSAAALDRLEAWCRQELASVRGLLERRRRDGFIRECHGDLHLGNLALIDGTITPFDCIEFNPLLRWIDVMSETAFLMMDLLDRGYAGMAYRFLNGYLQLTGDHAGLRVLRYYLVYRALVRAKVSVLRYVQSPADAENRAEAWREYTGYRELAGNWARTPRPCLVIMHGVSGSGKSWCAERLAERLGAIRLRSDVERKRLFGLPAGAKTAAGVQAGIYSEDASRQTYRQLAALTGSVLAAGFPVIIDAAFLKHAERRQFSRLAAGHGVYFALVHSEADMATLKARIRKRQADGSDPSEAGVKVLESQLATQQPLSAAELAAAFCVREATDADIEALAERIRQGCARLPDGA